jgi:ceramide glucosyltransferase
MAVVTYSLLALTVLGLIAYLAGAVLSVGHTRRAGRIDPAAQNVALPPVTLLKPLKGLEEALEENLASFYVQDYPAPFEVVFATTEADDPALAVARRVAARHPGVATRFVLSDPGFGPNPKVANLQGALLAADHDLVLQTDANVRVARDYLRRLVAEHEAAGAGLSSSVVVGVDEREGGAAMENLHLGGFIAPATAFVYRILGITCVIGKSMLMRRSELFALGGLETVRDVLCEDFVLGEVYARAGFPVVLSSTTVENVNRDGGPSRLLSRHGRWLKLRAVISPSAFLGDLLGNPVALSIATFAASGLDPRFLGLVLAVVAARIGAEGWVIRRLRGTPMRWRHRLLSPVKDLLIAGLWPYAAVSRSVVWRGTPMRIGSGSRLLPHRSPLPVRAVRAALAPLRARAA